MIDNYKNEDILFLDIETVPQFESYNQLPDAFKELWAKKAKKISAEEESPEEVYQRAGIYAEFGKIICISVGLIVNKDDKIVFRVKSFADQDEAELLKGFVDMLNKFSAKPNATLCAHNGKEFDFPYIARRCLINGIRLPKILDIAGKKPWEVMFLDTMELWKFGDYKHYTSLNLLTHIFNIPTPKDDIDGSQVAEVFYKEKDLERIVRYCEKDVLAVAQLLLRYKNEPTIEPNNIEVAH
ncbi:MAG: 3'-5' exonuclease [Bacteroidales bacterium]|jgi:DNA polymerase elongation subunit (family B)|nr:3'-5' exonuclease [Bacteroidales bacterium]MDD4385030.1 3'-5' exonuclease [Bacteroidales bacterium]MDY0196662.1 3'-5' exonuclease [Tenuifilaceae bacterium]